MTTRVAINGFGRIGRQVVKAVHERYWDALEIVVVGITDPFITENRALLLKHDSLQGTFDADVKAVVEGRTNAISVDGRLIEIVGRNPYGPVPEWRRWDIDLVLEATGYCKDRTAAQSISWAARAGCSITAPAKKADLTVVLGVNEAQFDPGAAPDRVQRQLHHQLPGAGGQGRSRTPTASARGCCPPSTPTPRRRCCWTTRQGPPPLAGGGAEHRARPPRAPPRRWAR